MQPPTSAMEGTVGRGWGLHIWHVFLLYLGSCLCSLPLPAPPTHPMPVAVTSHFGYCSVACAPALVYTICETLVALSLWNLDGTSSFSATSAPSKIVPVSSIAPEGWGPKEGGNATSPLHSRGSPTKETKSEVKTYARGHHDAPSISKRGSLVQPGAQIAALC